MKTYFQPKTIGDDIAKLVSKSYSKYHAIHCTYIVKSGQICACLKIGSNSCTLFFHLRGRIMLNKL